MFGCQLSTWTPLRALRCEVVDRVDLVVTLHTLDNEFHMFQLPLFTFRTCLHFHTLALSIFS